MLCIGIAVLLFNAGCIEIPRSYPALPPGTWRATLDLTGSATDQPFDERSNGLLPFNFDLKYNDDETFYIEIRNGKEIIRVDSILYGRDRSIQKDTVRLVFPVFESYIRATYEEDALEGYWHVPARPGDYSIRFKALHSKPYRFSMIEPPGVDFSGRWQVEFNDGTGDQYPAAGVFSQDSSGMVTGTFETPTGDYRYLEGKASENRMYLSTFDGSHAFLFEAKYLEDGTLSGIFRSGTHYKTYWSAIRNDTFNLESASVLTKLKAGVDKFAFTFPNTSGENVSLEDPKYRGRPKIIQLLGTYCPNCRDATTFLSEYLRSNPEAGLEVIGLAFERHDRQEDAFRAIDRYKDMMDVPYEILYAGTSSKADASRALPMLNSVMAFPTFIFLDRNDKVVHVYTGISGPATEGYSAFSRTFEQYVADISAD